MAGNGRKKVAKGRTWSLNGRFWSQIGRKMVAKLKNRSQNEQNKVANFKNKRF
jgi:hypothetical protein